MAQYPGAVPSFATIQDGIDYPQAAHINDRQAEIVALADALKNGIAHPVTLTSTNKLIVGGELSAGASTLASLNVTGASTFAGAVTFGGGIAASLTLSSGASVSTGVIRQNSLPMWNVYRSTHVTLSSGSSNGIAFDTQDFVRGDIGHSTTTNSSRVTVNTTGVYQLNATVPVANSSGNAVVKLHIRQNDVTNVVSVAQTLLAAANVPDHLTVTHDVRLGSTCYLTCVVVSSGHASTVGSSSPFYAVRFSGHFVG